jgi:DNA invertase Pin-like site-specific DNA recombinase
MLAIYTRLSREDEDSTSIENQLREGREFAQLNRFDDFKIFNEGEGISGTLDIDKRPEFKNLLNSIISNEIDVVWFRNQNRAERNSLTFHIFIDACKKNNTKIYHADKEFDYNNANELLTGSILSTLNAYTAQLQSQQTKKALLDNIKEGKVHGVLAYGYAKNENGYLIVNEVEAKIIVELFERHAQGVGCRSLADEMNERNIPTRYSELPGTIKLKNKRTGSVTHKLKSQIKWSDKQIQTILKNSMYHGERVWNQKVYPIPRIVSKELFDKSISAFDSNKNNRGKKVEHKYLLKNKIECGKCGRNMYGRVNKKDSYYMCSSKRIKGGGCGNRGINIKWIEGYIWERHFLKGEVIKSVELMLSENGAGEALEKINVKIDVLKYEIELLNSDRKRAVGLAVKGLIPEEDIEKELSKIKLAINFKEDEIKSLEKESLQFRTAAEVKRGLKENLKSLNITTPHSTKRKVLDQYIKNINVTYEKPFYLIKIDYHHSNKYELHLMDFNYKVAVMMHDRSAWPLRKDVDPIKELEKLNIYISAFKSQRA